MMGARDSIDEPAAGFRSYLLLGERYSINERAAAFFTKLVFCGVIIIVVGTVLSIPFLFIWLDKTPIQPQQFQVYTFSISNFRVTNDSKVSFAADVWLTARNPGRNEGSLSFGRADVGVYYRSLSLARTAMPPFSVDLEGEAHLKMSFDAVGNFVERESVVLDLKLSSSVRYGQDVWRRDRGRRLFEVFCGGLLVGIPGKPTEVGVLVGGPRLCWEK